MRQEKRKYRIGRNNSGELEIESTDKITLESEEEERKYLKRLYDRIDHAERQIETVEKQKEEAQEQIRSLEGD